MLSFVFDFLCQSNLFVRLFIWLREFLSENRIPDTLFDRLKSYIPELSKNLPDLDRINRCLEQDIAYLNSKEEFKYIQQLSRNHKGNKSIAGFNKKIIKFYCVKILGYQDILELYTIWDRVFILDIHMDIQDSIYKFFYRDAQSCKLNFYFKIKLSSIKTP